MWLLEFNPLITALVIILLLLILIWKFSKPFNFKIEYAHEHWLRMDAADKLLEVADNMAQDLQEYADANEDAKDDPFYYSYMLLEEYNAAKKKLGVI